MKNAIIPSNSISDEEIIKKIINGKSELFEQLISKYDCLLYKIARRYNFDHESANDLLQDTHIAVYCKLSQFKFNSTFKTWLSKIMIHKCLYKLKYGYKKYEECSSLRDKTINCPKICNEFENAEMIFLKKELQNALQKTIKKLPFVYKTVFILRAVEGYSVAETANLLNISAINVRVRLSRAKTMLQKKLKYLYSSVDF
ncbi:MAG TPA: sigma-70 family RNA polymerase sigma factor [Hanamia sp.]|jgi:RNA polymerase sigma factor (sigma-70 family)|nr:sigma-70 family RNA polymerase sigma factor [Hanamia sp.]